MRKILGFALAGVLLTGAMIGLVEGAVPAQATPTHTTRVVVRPVHADGRPVKGYRVVSQSFAGFTCYYASSHTVSPNVYDCGFPPWYTPSCWKSTGHTVLCLRNPRLKQLVRIRYSGPLPRVSAPRHPRPQALTLGNGNYCQVRIGGSWSPVSGHPTWFGFYWCHISDIYGPRTNHGINQSTNPWQVHTVTHAYEKQQHIYLRRVATAYYVGTAA